MTYEQYGSGPWLVSISENDFHGSYRFETEDEAKAWRDSNGGELTHEPGEFGDIHQLAAAREVH